MIESTVRAVEVRMDLSIEFSGAYSRLSTFYFRVVVVGRLDDEKDVGGGGGSELCSSELCE